MGADGGITWMKVLKPEKYSRLLELVEPFHVTFWSNINGCGRHVESAHFQYLKENPELDSKNYLLGLYGTDIRDLPSLEDLQTIYVIICDRETLSFYGIDANKHTFLDLLEERETRPDDWWDYGPYHGVNFILKIMEFYDFDNGKKIREEPIYKMKLLDWAKEIESILDIKGYISKEETWT